MAHVTVKFMSHNRKAVCAPDPAFPEGIDIDVSDGAKIACRVQLPYPAECCGIIAVRCERCGFSAAVTTAGRADDPRSVKLPCYGGYPR